MVTTMSGDTQHHKICQIYLFLILRFLSNLTPSNGTGLRHITRRILLASLYSLMYCPTSDSATGSRADNPYPVTLHPMYIAITLCHITVH
jgi:hypothetical protein